MILRTAKGRSLRVLDFDIENRPLSYLGYDRVSAQITAIAAQFVGESVTHCWALGEATVERILEGFLELYDQADVVTGHYIRGHDLPIINGALIELGMPVLAPKLTQDTKNDLVKFSDLSKSQKNLSAMLGLPLPKVDMHDTAWREANQLTPEGIAGTKARCIGDVHQHIEMRRRLLELGYLNPPRLWRPTGKGVS